MKIKFLLLTALFTLLISCDSDDGANSNSFQEVLQVSIDGIDVPVSSYTAIRTTVVGRNILNISLSLANGGTMTVNVEGSSVAGIYDLALASSYSIEYFPTSAGGSNATGVISGEIDIISHDMTNKTIEVEFDETVSGFAGQSASFDIIGMISVPYTDI
ncbi:hypothetical protein LY01_01074 [Nonlabens xylanidelens]|uniref:Calx-beta domain-containing protein n=1 Tax=Nonlabens xylanidelens TaxID=191564 RepID=A0A2S6IMV6_9FLAO|nr:hypothetical protein [Nonlabens xylanidelens]PPK95486.1 hypothetical protein LY01_01074 [Nonlabens xylanidelens]PQJ22299.1 hypothetical protein BST94_01630 [Nonlabens xylanidelens]